MTTINYMLHVMWLDDDEKYWYIVDHKSDPIYLM